MYITSLDNVSGLLPPYRSTLLPDNNKRVKLEQGRGCLPFTCGEIHFPKKTILSHNINSNEI